MGKDLTKAAKKLESRRPSSAARGTAGNLTGKVSGPVAEAVSKTPHATQGVAAAVHAVKAPSVPAPVTTQFSVTEKQVPAASAKVSQVKVGEIPSVEVPKVDPHNLLFMGVGRKHWSAHERLRKEGGWAYGQYGDREFIFSDPLQLPNNMRSNIIGHIFSVTSGKELLNVVLDSYAAHYPAEVEITKVLVDACYDMARADNTWNVASYFTNMLRDEEIMADLMDDPELPTNVSLETIKQHTPDIFQAVNMLSLREYMALNGLVFPKYGTEVTLDLNYDSLANRLLQGEINPIVSDMLANTYLHSVNAREISAILEDVEKFVAEQGRLPGIRRWSIVGKKEGNVRLFTLKDLAQQEEYEELTLGMEFLIAIKAVPTSSFAWKISPDVHQKIALWSNKVKQKLSVLQGK